MMKKFPVRLVALANWVVAPVAKVEVMVLGTAVAQEVVEGAGNKTEVSM